MGAERLDLHEVNRFANRPVRTGGRLHWDILSLYAGILDGLRACGRDAGRRHASRIAEVCAETGQTPPQNQVQTIRCILDSLALAYRRTVRAASTLSGRPVEVVHLVGGGACNALLCQLTAAACGLPVVAGAVEAAALGNALVQARIRGAVAGGLPELRALLRATQETRTYRPSGDPAAWDAAEGRLNAC